ncbi:aminotransferase class V-fold PLP-dependent enzyme [Paracoccus sp. S-4012]|uniref:aminotransferase class V-fold PLP-dependent enzyme n=1 Tax=Paracoccus sp. S-4012 TaxID=2665648 RepID=UPI0012B0D859|nr:aminotransferase class V-fold PLP-dependent enzyme [Paracoccus sp. S-4012]MRX50209.1 aminotransferase class V-fold PLP-dependent enzyme [Paracoccus sp. S-4012]
MDDGSGYLLYHSIGQYPGKARDLAAATAAFAEIWARPDDGQWPAVLGLRARFLDRWRALIGAPEASLTTAENVTAAVAALMLGLPEEVLRGRKVLVAADCFPSVHFLLSGLAPRLGFTLETVPMRQGAAWVEDEDFAAAWGPEVGVALLTWISSTSSHRIDLEGLVAHGRARGSVIGVDITQGAGLLPFDVMAPAVDFTVSTSLKWLCGSPGAGMLHVAPDLTRRCTPAVRGWFSQPDPFNWDLEGFAYASDTRRFDSGTPSVMAAAASLPALDWHAAQEAGALLAQNRALSEQLADGLHRIGLQLVSPADPEARGGSVMARIPDDGTSAVLAAMRAAGTHADARGPVLRLSPGIMTTGGGVDRALAAIADALRA